MPRILRPHPDRAPARAPALAGPGPADPRRGAATRRPGRPTGSRSLGKIKKKMAPGREMSFFIRLVLLCIDADFLQPNTHFSACFEIYKIYIPLHRSDCKILAKNCHRFLENFI